MNHSLPGQNPPSDKGTLDSVLVEFLRARDAGQNPDKHQWAARIPEQASEFLSFFANEDAIRPHLQDIVPNPLFNEPLKPPFRFGEYDVIRLLGEGGMGAVYEARNRNLYRREALKLIRGYQTPEEVQRFSYEAQAVAKLDNPGIVHVYGVGELQGRHYISMEFVDGPSLKDAVAGKALPARQAASIVREVALAVEHAHQKGVIHRDLKPANILLATVAGTAEVDKETPRAGLSTARDLSASTPFGSPRVVDFGLAKLLDAETTLGAAKQILGTPQYMSPEQARGESKTVRAASDIYSLGVILYELLTGRPPFQSANRDMLLKQVCNDEPIAPRRHDPSIPRDLDTICLKCLEKSPAQRFATAAELAADLARFLAGEPIVTRPKSRFLRAAGWVRRHPATAGVLAVIVAVTIISPLFALHEYQSAVREKSLREAAQRSEAKAKDERDRADRYFRNAGQLINQLNDANRQLTPIESARSVQSEMEKILQKYYLDFLDDARVDPKLQEIRAESLQRVAALEVEYSDPRAAVKLLEEAIRIQERLVNEHPDNPGYEVDLNISRNNLFANLERSGRIAEASAVMKLCLDSRKKLYEHNLDDFETRRNLALTQSNFGLFLIKHDRFDEGAALVREAQLSQRSLAKGAEVIRTQPRVAAELGLTCMNLGAVLEPRGDVAGALAALQEAQDIFQQLSKAHPQTFEFQRNLAQTYFNLASTLRKQGNLLDAIAAILNSEKTTNELVKAQPGAIENWHWQVAVNHLQGVLFLNLEKVSNAEGVLRQARRLCDAKLLTKSPKSLVFRTLSAQIDGALSDALVQAQNFAEAETVAQRAVTTWESLVAEQGENRQYPANLAYAQTKLGSVFHTSKNFEEALRWFRTGLTLTRELLAREPKSERFRFMEITCLGMLAQISREAKNSPATRQALTELHEAALAAMQNLPDDPDYRFYGALALNDLGMTYSVENKPAEALPYFDRGLALMRGTPEMHRSEPGFTEQNVRLLTNRCDALCQLKRPAEGIPSLQEFLPLLKKIADESYAVAAAMARCIPHLPESERPAVAQQAISALKQAIDAGLKDVPGLRGDPDLGPLRELPEFEPLIKTIAQ